MRNELSNLCHASLHLLDGHGFPHGPPLLPPGPTLGVLTAVVGVSRAVGAVATFTSAGHVTRTARRHETLVAVVALTTCEG